MSLKRITITLPKNLTDYIHAQIDNGVFASSSEFVRDLIRQDMAEKGHAMRARECGPLKDAQQRATQQRDAQDD